MRPTRAQREAAAKRLAAARLVAGKGSLSTQSIGKAAVLTPNATPDYFGIIPNYALSPLPLVDNLGNVAPGTGIRKFVDSLPGLGAGAANDLGQYIPVATPDNVTYGAGYDYYVIALVRYTEKLHADLPPTTLQGYVQMDTSGVTMLTPPSYLGPTIVAQRGKPVRVKFINKLPTGLGGNLFLPVDTTVMGAGLGPTGQPYTQNRATLHLHGGATPWISDGTPHQWTTPANENTPYQEGVSVKNVPDMDGGNEPTGTLTFYYTNQQSARLMFYHDHSYGLTRLNVYAGEAAPYVLRDPVEKALVNGGPIAANGTTVMVPAGTIPADEIPLVIQDKTFVPQDSQLATQDPTWDKARWGGLGSLWLPHVYMPNQNIADPQGLNAMGRWDYAFWMFPPLLGIMNGPVVNPLANPAMGEPAMNPGTPSPTIIPESFMDTPLVNGTAYPYVKVQQKAYRFRILNASDDRMFNLQLYRAKSDTPDSVDNITGNPTLQKASGDVSMTPAVPHPNDPSWPARWPTDGRDGGVPDPSAQGPSMIQIGNEGGFLPTAAVLPNTPVGYEYFRRTILVLNVSGKTLYMGPAERADVVVDFSQLPVGAKVIMYNDAPAPTPGYDTRVDYYTGDPDQTTSGGAPTTQPGYGPNTRTIMQFQVVAGVASPAAFDVANLQTGLRQAYAASQEPPIVPESVYGPIYNTTYPDTMASVLATGLTFTPAGSTTPVTLPFQEKAILEGFDTDYGRMNAQLGQGLPNTGFGGGAAVNYGYVDPPNDDIVNTPGATKIGQLNDGTQIWKLEHQGVDTHAIHFHLFNVQVINRIAIDGQVLPPDPNELGWKETIRTNPGTSILFALRAVAPTLPFKLPDSIRPINPTLPVGATFNAADGTPIVNDMMNFGWEYVWHCHLLGHEDNDMMRPMRFGVSPAAPVTLTGAAVVGPQVNLHWTNTATNPAATNYLVTRATDAAFTAGLTTFTLTGTPVSYVDTTVVYSKKYFYKVRAENAISYSVPANVVSVSTPMTPGTAVIVYRLRNNRSGEFFFTASLAEKNSLGAPWVYEGPAWSMNPANTNNSVAVWRLYNTRTGLHLYSTSVAEINSLIAPWRVEGIAFYVSMTPTDPPVYRLYNRVTGIHLLTADPAERNAVAAMWLQWTYEGVAFYIGQ